MKPNQTTVLILLTFGSVATPDEAKDVSYCRQAICRFDVPPECQQWLTVDCDFINEYRKRVNLTSTSFPENVQEIYISNAERVELQASAMEAIKFLKKISFQHVGELVIRGKSLTLNTRSEEILVGINHVNSLKIHTNAFAGWQMKIASISVSNIIICHLMESAFPASSSIEAIQLEDIQDLQVERHAFASSIEKLTIKTVSMKACKSNTFSGTINSLLLDRIKIDNIERECMAFDDFMVKLRINSCHFQFIKSFGFRGIVKYVMIESNEIGFIDTNGFNLRVFFLQMHQNTIKTIKENAMDIEAIQFVRLTGLVTTILHKHAFYSIKIWSNNGESKVLISDIFLTKAENESLVLEKPEEATFHRIVFSQKCSCGIKQRAIQVFSTPDNLAGIARNSKGEMIKKLSETRCLNESGSPIPILNYYHTVNCSDPTAPVTPTTVATSSSSSIRPDLSSDGDGESQTEESQSVSDGSVSTETITLYIVIGVLVAFILSSILAITMWCVRRNRRREKSDNHAMSSRDLPLLQRREMTANNGSAA